MALADIYLLFLEVASHEPFENQYCRISLNVTYPLVLRLDRKRKVEAEQCSWPISASESIQVGHVFSETIRGNRCHRAMKHDKRLMIPA